MIDSRGVEVDSVRTSHYGRVKVTFTPTGWELQPDPVDKSDLIKWYWWSFGVSIMPGWIGFVLHALFGVPEEIALILAAPGALLLAGLLVYGVVVLIGELGAPVLAVFMLVRGFFRLFTLPWRRKSTPPPAPEQAAPPLAVMPATAVVEARVRHRWRRVVITTRMVDGVEIRYSRFGLRHDRRVLEEGFAAHLSQRLVTA